MADLNNPRPSQYIELLGGQAAESMLQTRILWVSFILVRACDAANVSFLFTGVNSSVTPGNLSSILSLLNFTSYTYAESDPYLSLQTCGAGTITPALAQSTCVACAAGTFQSAAGQSTCANCGGGYYSNSNATGATSSSICSACPQGSYANAGDAVCSVCPANTWSDVAYGACASCPGNSSSPGGTYLFGCICGPGFQYDRLFFPYSCDQCQAGTWSPGDSEICIPCAAGSASPFRGAVSAGSCSTCGAGYYAGAGFSQCMPCVAGSIAPGAASSSCSPCPQGYWAPGMSTQCVPCGAGTYNTGTGIGDASLCLGCAGGTYATGSAQSACGACSAGSYTPAGGSQCLVCASGTFAEAQSTSCVGCPVNSVGPGGTDATGCACNAGYYPFYRTRGTGGVESVVGSTLKQHVFTADGNFVLYIATQVTMYCGSTLWGSFSWSKGAQAITVGSCGQITVTYFISGAFYAGDSPTYFKCAACAPGYISAAGDALCQACPAGTEQPSAGSSACNPCNPGYVSASPGTPSCSQCPAGTIQFGTNLQTCTTCPLGSYSNAGTTTCLACPANTYSQGGASQCTPCPYFSISLGGGGIGQCVCQSGYLAAYTPSVTCAPCPDGSYSLLNATSCVSCGPGTFSVSPAVQCTQCARGTYQPSSGLASCVPCPAGTLSPAGATDCSACPAPLYCTGGGVFYSCPLGTYSNLLGLQSADQCPICPVNSFCQSSGEIEACPAHTTSAAGSTSKLNCLCNPGYVCTYRKAVRVNITLPLTQAQFDVIKDQFLQSVAAAAGVDVSQVSIIGLTLLSPTRRLLLLSYAEQEGLVIMVHIKGAERLHRLGPHLRRLPGIHRVRVRSRTAHKIVIHRLK